MAVKLYLADGSTTDIVCVTTPVFVVRTPEDFLELMLARKPDPETGQPDMERLGAFLGAHPEAMPAIQHTLGNPPPVSYLTCAYNSLHAYRFTNAGGEHASSATAGSPRRGGERRRGRGGPRLRTTTCRTTCRSGSTGPARFTLSARSPPTATRPTTRPPPGRTTASE